jgi:hypothetical protein
MYYVLELLEFSYWVIIRVNGYLRIMVNRAGYYY